MGNKLHTVIQTAVVLYVKIVVIFICSIIKLSCIIVITSAAVNLKLNSHIHITLTVKNRYRLEIVAVDTFAVISAVAGNAVRIIFIIKIAGIIFVYKPAAVFTADVMIVPTV